MKATIVNSKWFLAVTAGLLAVGTVRAEEFTKVIVTADRVNMRAKAVSDAEVVTQASLDEKLLAKSFKDGWVEVVPPDHAELYVHGDFVRDAVVQVPKLNVRSGANANHSVVGLLFRGEKVDVRGTFGDWLKIGAPESASLYISRQFVESIAPPRPPPPEPPPERIVEPVPPRPPDPPPQEIVSLPNRIVKPVEPLRGIESVSTIPPPPDLDLIPLKGQGRTTEKSGLLSKSSFVISAPSKYRLIRNEDQVIVTVCYVRGNRRQLDSLKGRQLKIVGREYWVQGIKYPVLVPEKIVAQKKRTF